MILFLTKNSLKNAVFHYQTREKFSENYLREREIVWQKHLDKAKNAGKSVWNGIIYTLEDIIQTDEQNLHLVLGTCEFKDIVFRINKGVSQIIEKYGISHINKYITLDCIPVTNDGKFIFGIRGKTTNVASGSIGLIGGTANKDEMLIKSEKDLSSFMIMEIEEETNIKVQEENLFLFSINQFNGKYEFLYLLELDIDSHSVRSLHKEGEFSDLICLTARELHEYKGKTLDAFRYAQSYIDKIKI
jgi:8-oxo-dGTP pyrophosphatase MutT (NUDIX family)